MIACPFFIYDVCDSAYTHTVHARTHVACIHITSIAIGGYDYGICNTSRRRGNGSP